MGTAGFEPTTSRSLLVIGSRLIRSSFSLALSR